MSGNQKGFSTVVFAFALVTLLSCFSPVSSYFTLPRVSRTSDAIIIDYEGVGYSPFSLGRVYGQFVDPGFVPLPAFNPYGMFYGGWSHFARQVTPAPAATCGRGPPLPARSAISERVSDATGTASTVVTASKTWPFLVVLRKSTADPNVFFCSGTLISDTRVLLAAQCLEQLSVYDISTVTVLIGLISVTAGAAAVPATTGVTPTNMAAMSIANPRMPLLAPIPGGFMHGKIIRIQGSLSPNAQRFTVNLQCGPNTDPQDDLALHFDARIHERVVVRNSRISGVWGQEERHGMFPFVPGQRFEILLLAESDNYKIVINGQHFAEFRSRTPMERVSSIYADGEIMISMINFEAVPGSSVVQMTRRISRVVIHSGYNAATYANDIAIISLDMPVVLSNRVGFACLPTASADPDQFIDQTALVMGWGPAAAGAASTEFRQGPVAIVANDNDCRSLLGYGVFVTVNNICIASSLDAAGTDTSAYTCAADVGGPVVVNIAVATPPGTPPPPAVWTVVGINSFTPADACTASPKRHGLKTRVSAFSAWITTYMV